MPKRDPFKGHRFPPEIATYTAPSDFLARQIETRYF